MDSSGDQQMPWNNNAAPLGAGTSRHVSPSGDVIMFPLDSIATNNDNCGDQIMLRQVKVSCAEERNDHVRPSFDTMTFCFVVETSEETATKSRSSGDQQTFRHADVSSADGLGVHVTPSLDVTTRWAPALATPTNIFRSGDQHTDVRVVDATEYVVHVTPSEDVTTRFEPPDTNNRSCGDQQIEFNPPVWLVDLGVHAMPSGEVIMLLSDDDDAATAANNAISEAQHTSVQSKLEATVCNVHSMPLADVMTFLFSDWGSSPPTATKIDFSGAQQTPCHCRSPGARKIQVLVASSASARLAFVRRCNAVTLTPLMRPSTAGSIILQ